MPPHLPKDKQDEEHPHGLPQDKQVELTALPQKEDEGLVDEGLVDEGHHEVLKPTICGFHIWVLKVVTGAIAMGVGSFIYAKNFSHQGFLASGYLAPIGVILTVGY